MRFFSIRDIKAESFMDPFMSQNAATAVRMVSQAVNDPAHQFNKYPEDYVLFEVGGWNQETGELESQTPYKISGCLELITAQSFLESIGDRDLVDAAKAVSDERPFPADNSKAQSVR